jgi:hypothetical protein
MPTYAIPQTGSNPDPTKNLTTLSPGDKLTLISAADAAGTGFKSVAFAKGYSPGGTRGFPVTYILSGCPNGSVVEIQWSGADVDAQYGGNAQIALDSGGDGNGAYTDAGASPFYRAVVVTLNAGDVPVLVAQA